MAKPGQQLGPRRRLGCELWTETISEKRKSGVSRSGFSYLPSKVTSEGWTVPPFNSEANKVNKTRRENSGVSKSGVSKLRIEAASLTPPWQNNALTIFRVLGRLFAFPAVLAAVIGSGVKFHVRRRPQNLFPTRFRPNYDLYVLKPRNLKSMTEKGY